MLKKKRKFAKKKQYKMKEGRMKITRYEDKPKRKLKKGKPKGKEENERE